MNLRASLCLFEESFGMSSNIIVWYRCDKAMKSAAPHGLEGLRLLFVIAESTPAFSNLDDEEMEDPALTAFV